MADGSISIREYFAVEGSRFSHRDAKVIGPELYRIANHKGMTAEIVVVEASKPESPLHKYFEWDDPAAANLWRLEEARRMIRSIKIRYVEDNQEHTVRAFNVIKTEAWSHKEPRRYRTFEVLHGDTAFAANMMDQALADLRSWRGKYETHIKAWESFAECFEPMLNQISEFEDEVRVRDVAAGMETAAGELLAWRDKWSADIGMWAKYGRDIEYVMEAIAYVEEVMAKRDDTAERSCLKCQQPFKSAHKGHRICSKCFGTFDKESSGLDEHEMGA